MANYEDLNYWLDKDTWDDFSRSHLVKPWVGFCQHDEMGRPNPAIERQPSEKFKILQLQMLVCIFNNQKLYDN